jgi:FkbM family methyltransferase
MLPHDLEYQGIAKLPLGDSGRDGILDIGANMGLSALSFRKFFPKIKIMSIEPNPRHEDWLAKIKVVDRDFDYSMVGAGDAQGEFVLYLPYYRKVPLHTMASIQYEALKRNCDEYYGANNKRIHIRSIQVDIVTIDQFKLSPEFIKIDAENFEIPILRGALETIKRCKPCLFVENNNVRGMEDLLAPLGYEKCYWDTKGNRFTTQEIPARNVFFLPSAVLAILPRQI